MLNVLVHVPAEAVAAQPQVRCIRSPCVVELTLDKGGVPREAASAAPSDSHCASVRLARAQLALLVLIWTHT